MTHNEPRGHWVREGLIGLGTGIVFGITVVAVAHPFDTIKTYMQAQPGFENFSMLKTAKSIIKSDGFIGLYRGCVPPLWGSGVYRSVQFSVFEGTYTGLDNEFGRYEIPGTHGTQVRVFFGGLASGAVRSLIETPLEYAKIKASMWPLLETQRYIHFFGPFLGSGCSSVLAWWVCWPLEYVKCQIQGGYMTDKNMSIVARLRFIVKERGGFLALYRGIAPGSLRSFVGNGSAMAVMQYLQKKVSEWGLRG